MSVVAERTKQVPTLDTFDDSFLNPLDECELIGNRAANEALDTFFADFARFNREVAIDPSSARLPECTALFVKGPPGGGKSTAVEFFMRKHGIKASRTFDMALESRNCDFVNSNLFNALNTTPFGASVVLRDVDALSISGKASPADKLSKYLEGPGMAMGNSLLRKIRDNADAKRAAKIADVEATIREAASAKHKRGTKRAAGKASKGTVAKPSTADGSANQADINREAATMTLAGGSPSDVGGKRKAKGSVGTTAAPQNSMKRARLASQAATMAKFSRNTKARVSGTKRDPKTLYELYRQYYPFTTHVPLVMLANDHEYHSMFARVAKMSHCCVVQFRQPKMENIVARIEQIFLRLGIRAAKPKGSRGFLVSEIAAYASGDIRKAMRTVRIGIQRALLAREAQAGGTLHDQDYLALKRRFVSVFFDEQQSNQKDHFTAVSFLALGCPDIDSALQHVARPRLPMVPITLYECFARLLPHAPAATQKVAKRQRASERSLTLATTTPRSTKNSNKCFSVQNLKKKLFPFLQQAMCATKSVEATSESDDRFCSALMDRYLIASETATATTKSNEEATEGGAAIGRVKRPTSVLNRAAEAICRADFEEVFSAADMIMQEFRWWRSTPLQQTWQDSAVMWSYILRNVGDRYSSYGLVDLEGATPTVLAADGSKACTAVATDDKDGGTQVTNAGGSTTDLAIGFVQTRPICTGRRGKLECGAANCTCRWLITPSLKGSLGVRLQWFKSSTVERESYDTNTAAVCQSSCVRFFYYTNYISSMLQVRKRGQLLVNL